MNRFNKHKALTLLLYLAEQNGGTMNKMKALKLIWLADRYHLRQYGRTITGDKYYAMERGTVPSSIKNTIEGANGESSDAIQQYDKHYYRAIEKADLDNLSQSDQEAIDKVIAQYFKNDQYGLSIISHDFPEWKRFEDKLTPKGHSRRFEMDMEDFFKDVDDGTGLFVSNPDFIEDSRAIYKELN